MQEIGRELRVSELQPKTVVVVSKQGRPAATMWVMNVAADYVHFSAGAIGMHFIAVRTGPELEQITDQDQLPMKIFEYLGKV